MLYFIIRYTKKKNPNFFPGSLFERWSDGISRDSSRSFKTVVRIARSTISARRQSSMVRRITRSRNRAGLAFKVRARLKNTKLRVCASVFFFKINSIFPLSLCVQRTLVGHLRRWRIHTDNVRIVSE